MYALTVTILTPSVIVDATLLTQRDFRPCLPFAEFSER